MRKGEHHIGYEKKYRGQMNDCSKGHHHHPVRNHPDMLSKFCRKNSCLGMKQDPQSIFVVSFYVCGWNGGDGLLERK